jgi:hypothetical protein
MYNTISKENAIQICNQTHIKDKDSNSVLEYTFPGGGVNFNPGCMMALASLSLYNSTFNITQNYNNNKFNYVWVNNLIYSVVIPNGYYEVATINNYLHFVQEQNGHYLVSTATGQYVYFATLDINATAYAVQVTCFNMSTALYPDSLYTVGTSVNGTTAWSVPAASTVPQIQILNNQFTAVIGYPAGNYPSEQNYVDSQSFLSAFAPQVSPLSSYTLACSLLNNDIAIPNSLLYSFSPSGVFGTLNNIMPTQLVFIKINPGCYNSFQVTFTDQNNARVYIEDPNIVVLLAISDPAEPTSK